MRQPVGTQVANSSGNVANANAIATLPAIANRVNYLTSVSFTGGGATAGSLVVATITGVIGGPLSFVFAVPTGVAVGAAPLLLGFESPLWATGPNVAIVATLPALGAGNTNAATSISGYVI
jgi:hypothetical protein